jgi:glutamine synthetase
MSNELQDLLRLPYAELEELNLFAKEQRMKRVPIHQIQEERLKYLTDEKRIKAVCTCSITTRSFSSRAGTT